MVLPIKRLALLIILILAIYSGIEYTPKSAPVHETSKSSESATQEPKSKERRASKSAAVARPPIVAGNPSRKSAVRLIAQQDIEAEKARRDQLLNGGFDFPDSNYSLMRMRAIPEADYRPEMGARVGSSFGFVIFADENSSGRIQVDRSRPVVAQKANGRLGIVTGTIIVKLRDPALAADVAQNHDLKLRFEEPDVRQAYYSAPELSALDEVVKALRVDPNVENVNLEVIQGKKKF